MKSAERNAKFTGIIDVGIPPECWRSQAQSWPAAIGMRAEDVLSTARTGPHTAATPRSLSGWVSQPNQLEISFEGKVAASTHTKLLRLVALTPKVIANLRVRQNRSLCGTVTTVNHGY